MIIIQVPVEIKYDPSLKVREPCLQSHGFLAVQLHPLAGEHRDTFASILCLFKQSLDK